MLRRCVQVDEEAPLRRPRSPSPEPQAEEQTLRPHRTEVEGQEDLVQVGEGADLFFCSLNPGAKFFPNCGTKKTTTSNKT